MKRVFVYVANAVDGDIAMFRMEGDGALKAMGRVAAGANVMPLAVSPDKRHLYAVVRSLPYSVITYRIDAGSGVLEEVAKAPLPDSMAYASTDRRGQWLFAASYGGDIITVTRIDANGLPQDEPTQVIRTGRHPHSIVAHPSNRFAYAGNLGVDRVLQFSLAPVTGTLAPIGEGFATAPAGSGPRHIAFSPDGGFVHVVGELSGSVMTYRVDATTGALTLVGEVNGMPPGSTLVKGIARAPGVELGDTPRIWASDIRVTPDGRFVYMAERTNSTISAFGVNPVTGELAYAGNCAVEKQPRCFNIDPHGRFMVVTGELSDDIGVYGIDSDTGALRRIGRHPVGQGANWVEIVEID